MIVGDAMKLTLLTNEQTKSENELEVFKKYGIRSAVTDLAILTGGSYCITNERVPDDNSLKGRPGAIYTKSTVFFPHQVSTVFMEGCIIDNEELYDQSCAIRPVLLSSSIFSQITPSRVKGFNGTEEVGEYPQYAPDKKIQNEYQNKKLQLTGINYTFKDSPNKDATCDEYEYMGKKYIRIEARYKCRLSNGKKYKKGDYVWIEVSPVVWLIDDENKTLISKRGILSGICFDDRYAYYGDFESTIMHRYLNNIMIKDLFQPRKVTKEKEVTEEKSNLEETKEKSKVELLLEEINSYIDLLPDNKSFKEKINKLINDYNEKLDRIKKEKNNTFSFETLDSITNDLEMSLNMILFDLIACSDYFDILDYINICLSCSDKDKQEEKAEEKDDLINDLVTLLDYCIPFLKEEDGNKIKEEVIKIFNSEKDNIEKYLNNRLTNLEEKDVKLNYSTKEDFVVEIRKRLHPILENLVDKVSKRDIELEITSATKSVINNTFEATKDSYLTNNFKEINNITKEINNYISQVEDVNKSQEFSMKLFKILSTEIDYTKDTKDIYKQILDMIISLHKLNLEVSDYIEEMKKLNNSYIKPIK